ncbi:hypothetical protein [Halovivax gelatinilyticus]|uniref:hypothetical protein n=1 Tax=Halovivax gelatinilyticus TaxID=2961597 RepID=UPI0020CA63F9|nr:hypothetical protein [Halovivax gelatinilyticus]
MNVATRIAWFVLVGWWFGVLWFLLACLAGITVIWYNVGLYMAVNTWRVMTRKAPLREIIEDVREVR